MSACVSLNVRVFNHTKHRLAASLRQGYGASHGNESSFCRHVAGGCAIAKLAHSCRLARDPFAGKHGSVSVPLS